MLSVPPKTAGAAQERRMSRVGSQNTEAQVRKLIKDYAAFKAMPSPRI